MSFQPDQESQPSSPEEPENLEGSSQKTLAAPTDLLKEAWKIFKTNLTIFMGIAVVPFLIWFLFNFLSFIPEDQALMAGALAILLGVVGFIVSFWSQLALFHAAKKEGNISIKKAYSKARGGILSFLWIGTLSSFIVAGGSVLLIIPGIIFGIWFSFALYVFVEENTKGFNALLKSKQYVEGFFGSVLWRQLFFGLISIVLILPIAIVGGLVPGVSADLVVNIVSVIVLAPFGVIYIYLLYRQLRKIKGAPSFSPSGKSKFGYFAVGLLGILLVVGMFGSTLFATFKSLSGAREKAADMRKVTQLKQVQVGLDLYYSKNRSYPSSLEQLSETSAPIDLEEDMISGIDYEVRENGESYEACVELKDGSDQCITPEKSDIDMNF